MTKEGLEAASAANAVSTKEESVVDKVDLTASSTMSEERSTVIKKLLEVMDLVRCIHDVDFRNLVEEHGLGAGEDINAKVNFELLDPPYNEVVDQNAENSKCDVIILEGMRDTTQMLGNMMNPGDPGHAFCSSI